MKSKILSASALAVMLSGCSINPAAPTVEAPEPVAAIVEAVYEGDHTAAKAELESGASPNIRDYRGYTLLEIASSLGDENIVSLLLDFGADPNVEPLARPSSTTAIREAIGRGHIQVLEVLLKNGADPHLEIKAGRSVMHSAAKWAVPDFVDILLKLGVDPDYHNSHIPFTPLFYAQSHEVVEKLLLAGADPNFRDPSTKFTPLNNFVNGGHLRMVKTMLKHGANPLFVDRGGRIPLNGAASNGHKEIVEYLLKANPNSVNGAEVPPLVSAANKGHAEIVDLLLSAGAIPNKSVNGKTAADYAEEKGHTQIAAALRSLGGSTTPKKSGFQWGKFAAIATGLAIGGATELSSADQAELLLGVVEDSLPGSVGMSSTQRSAQNITNRASSYSSSGGYSSGIATTAMASQQNTAPSSVRYAICKTANVSRFAANEGCMQYYEKDGQYCSDSRGAICRGARQLEDLCVATGEAIGVPFKLWSSGLGTFGTESSCLEKCKRDSVVKFGGTCLGVVGR